MNIPLTHGKVAVIDSKDWRKIALFKWRWERAKMESGYAVTNTPGEQRPRKAVQMHNLIMPPPAGFEIDHRDGDGLNNRRVNLRYATRAQQCMNRVPQRGKSSRFKGVRYWKIGGKWQARIRVDGREIHLGYFDTERDAALTYNGAAKVAHGEFARLNKIDGILAMEAVK